MQLKETGFFDARANTYQYIICYLFILVANEVYKHF